MTEELLEDIYLSLQGLLTPEAAVSGVPNLFKAGGFCDAEYAKVQEACGRICTRLGVEEDGDLNQILDSLERIQAALCREMFRLGMLRVSLS